jgi:tol-pal system protein YbgF
MSARLVFTVAAVLLAATTLTAPLVAASDPLALDTRVGSLEKQMKAVQRKVFPGGDPRFFTPDITPEAPAAAPEGTPATTPLADLTARVDTLERQQRTLTGAVEEAQNRLRLMEDGFAKYRGDTDFRLNAIEHPVAVAPTDAPPTAAPPAARGSEPGKPLGGKPPAKADAPKPSKTVALPVEDQWRAAFALYTAKDYDRAAAAMTDFLAANPKAARASNAQYWLGRTYFAQDRSAEAAKAFLDGYKNYADGDRAADSLLWLGKSLTALKKPKQACSALDELQSVYGGKMSPSIKSAAIKARADAKCGG